MATLEQLKQALATFEGYFKVGSVAQRNNNPGNLRYAGQAGAIPDANNYAVFQTPEAGWAALQRQLMLYASRDMTISGMMQIYAPPSDNNPTKEYTAYIASQLGVPDTTKVADLVDPTLLDLFKARRSRQHTKQG